MNKDKLKTFRFWETVDKSLTRERYSGQRRTSLYPSEASVIGIDPETNKASVVGGCLRKSYYRLKGFKRTNPSQIKGQYIMAFGKEIENFIIELAKTGFIYDNNNVKFFDPDSYVSGEVDLVVNHPSGGKIFIEVKSTYGYFSEKNLFGGFKGRGKKKVAVKGKPSDSHLLQIGIYLWTHIEDEDLLGGKLVYILRDNMSRTEFDITVELDEQTGKHRLCVDGKIDQRFFVEDIYDRFKMLIAAYKNNQLPERDHFLVFNDEQMKEAYEDGDISDTAWAKYEKSGERPMNFPCSYCDFKDECWTTEALEAHVDGENVIMKGPKKRVKPIN